MKKGIFSIKNNIHLAGKRRISTGFDLRPWTCPILQDILRKTTTRMREMKRRSQTKGVKILTRFRIGDSLWGNLVNQLKGL